MRKTVWAALVATLFAAPAAFAVSSDEGNSAYIGASGAYEINDTDREAKNGFGGQFTVGVPLSYTNGAVELRYSEMRRDRAGDGEKDFQSALMVGYVQDFGQFAFLKPFASVGLGSVQEDVLGSKHTHLGFDTSVGTLFVLPWRSIALRTEAVAQGHQNNNKSGPGNEDFVMDYRLMFGLQVPLMMAAPAAAPAEAPAAAPPEAADACGTKVVDGEAPRAECGSDSDHDGVADGADQCPGTDAGITVNDVGCPAVAEAAPVEAAPEAPTPVAEAAPAEPAPAPSGAVEGVSFKSASADLTDDAKGKLDALAAQMAADASIRVEIQGHTDSAGSEARNIVLGAQRAEAVRQYLIGKGVNGVRLTTLSFGEYQPVASNDTAEGREQNRSARVRVVR